MHSEGIIQTMPDSQRFYNLMGETNAIKLRPRHKTSI